MNILRLGPVHIPDGDCLLIADEAPEGFKIFDTDKHCINPLNSDPARAEALASIFYDGIAESTLTIMYATDAMVEAFTTYKRFDEIEWGKSDGEKEAKRRLKALMRYEVFKRVLNTTNTALKGRVCARLNRAELGEKMCFILGSILALLAPGDVAIDDFGFYARDFHFQLMRENRLSVGINSFSELSPKMKQRVLRFEDRDGERCSFDDAKILATKAGKVPGTEGFNGEVSKFMN